MDFLISNRHYSKSIKLSPYVYYYFECEMEHGYIAIPQTIYYPLFYTYYVKNTASPLSPWFEVLVQQSFSHIEERDRLKKLFLK